MKTIKAVFAAAAFILLLSPSLKAQEYPNAIKINFLSPLVSTINVSYERAFSDNLSGQLGFFYTSIGREGTKFRGYAITPEVRFYPGDEAIKGFYVGPFVRYRSLNLLTEDVIVDFDPNTGEPIYGDGKATLTTIGGGAVVGYQFVFGDLITLDPFIGPWYNSTTLNVKEGNEDDFNNTFKGGFGLRVGITAGITF